MLFILRHKAPGVGIVEGLIELDDPKADLTAAEKVGRQLCETEPGFLYISVRYAILNKRPKPVESDEFVSVRTKAS